MVFVSRRVDHVRFRSAASLAAHSLSHGVQPGDCLDRRQSPACWGKFSRTSRTWSWQRETQVSLNVTQVFLVESRGYIIYYGARLHLSDPEMCTQTCFDTYDDGMKSLVFEGVHTIVYSLDTWHFSGKLVEESASCVLML